MGARTSSSVQRVRGDRQRDRSHFGDDTRQQELDSLIHCLSVVHCEDEQEERTSDEQLVAAQVERSVPARDAERLADLIEQRIQARTSGRIRNLKVVCSDGQVRISGQCATFYTKQLAQHAAMGVIEDETVVNEIVVGFCR